MLVCMRTTINLPDGLLAQIKRLAADKGTTLTDVIADALREKLARKTTRKSKTPMPVFSPPPGEEGLLPGVDLDDTAALYDLMDEADAADRC